MSLGSCGWGLLEGWAQADLGWPRRARETGTGATSTIGLPPLPRALLTLNASVDIQAVCWRAAAGACHCWEVLPIWGASSALQPTRRCSSAATAGPQGANCLERARIMARLWRTDPTLAV